MKRERANPREIDGKQALFVVNLPPRQMAGMVSEGMLFDIGHLDGITPVLAMPDTCAGRHQSGIMLTDLRPPKRVAQVRRSVAAILEASFMSVVTSEGYGCREKQGCLRQARVRLFVATLSSGLIFRLAG